jgi:hypothetical protein
VIAKLLMVVAVYIALAPHIDTLKYRLLLNAVAVGGVSGLLGTATRDQALSMVPVNFLFGAVISLVVTLALHTSLARLYGSKARA